MDDVQALRQLLEARFDAVMTRLEDDRAMSTQRHGENVLRLQGIDAEVRRTNGRVTRTEEQIKSLFARLSQVATSAAGQKSTGSVDGAAVRVADLRWMAAAAVALFGAGAGVVVWLLKLIGKL